MTKFTILAFILTSLISFHVFAGEKVSLSPQKVVDHVLGRGLEAKAEDLLAQRSFLGLATAQGVYDFNLKIVPSYEYSEAESLSGASNVSDQTSTVSTSISKMFASGTTLSLGYDWINLSSKLSTIANSQGRKATQDYNAMSVGLRQALWKNSFGLANRLSEEVASSNIKDASDARVENLESVLLNAMTLFWSAYSTQVQLRESIATREKYEQLVKSAKRRQGFNLSTPGEVPRLEAEYLTAEANVKNASANYLNAVGKLLVATQLPPDSEIDFQVDDELPNLPELKSVELENLRSVRLQNRRLETARTQLRISNSNYSPKLDLVFKGKSVGVDEERSRSVSEMTGGSKPDYYIGAEFETSLDSQIARGQVADARVVVSQAEVELAKTRDQVRTLLSEADRNAIAAYHQATTFRDVVIAREKVVREMEVAFRQGRQSLTELIRSYNDLFSAQLEKAKSIGNYHVALNRLSAVRDELVHQ